MCKHAVALAQLGLRVHPCDWVVPTRDGAWESSQAAWQRKVAERDGTEVKSIHSPGKLPKLQGWQKLASNHAARVKNFWTKSRGGYPDANIGVATGPGSNLFVLDIDGEEGKRALAALVEQYGDLPPTVTVITQSGGNHYWFAWPEGQNLRNTASSLGSGIDTRGDGGFVIAPPSRGITGNEYKFAPGCGINEAPIAVAPSWLITLAFEATKGRKTLGETGEDIQSQVLSTKAPTLPSQDAMLLLDLRAYLDQIGDGEGRKGFDGPINSTACAYFKSKGVQADASAVKRVIAFVVANAPVRSDRTNYDRYRSDEYLEERVEKDRAFVKSKLAEKTVRQSYEFNEESELVAELNTMAAVLMDGDKVMVLVDRHDPPRFLKVADARNAFAPYKLIVPDGKRGKFKSVAGFDVWLKSELRREFTSRIFDPGGSSDPKAFNTYKGLSMQPIPGDWSLMQAHLFENVCRCDLTAYKALLSWIAQLLQEPARKLGSAVVLRGIKGCGKSIVALWLSRIIGDRHTTKVTNPRHLTGNFNAHFSEALLVVLEEGFWAGDHVADGVLKDFITSDTLLVEKKGVDAGQARNFARLLITSNASRVAPATHGERRFLVLDVSPARAKDQDYFAALDWQMRAGGAQAMLHDLLCYKFDERVLRDPPRTTGLIDQVIENLHAEERWWFTILEEGQIPGLRSYTWEGEGPLDIAMGELCASYNEFVPRFKGARTSASVVGKFIRDMIPNLPAPTRPKGANGLRSRYVELPPIDELRARFAERYGVDFGVRMTSAPESSWADSQEARLMFSQATAPAVAAAHTLHNEPANDGTPVSDVA